MSSLHHILIIDMYNEFAAAVAPAGKVASLVRRRGRARVRHVWKMARSYSAGAEVLGRWGAMGVGFDALEKAVPGTASLLRSSVRRMLGDVNIECKHPADVALQAAVRSLASAMGV